MQVVSSFMQALAIHKIKVVPFIDDMDTAYTWADLVISRAGAMSVTEICTVGVAAIYIPFPQAVDDHQTHNCKPVVAANGALMLAQKDLTAVKIQDLLQDFVTDRERLLAMAINARQLARPKASETLAEACKQYYWSQS